jgi:hypothetical protein
MDSAESREEFVHLEKIEAVLLGLVCGICGLMVGSSLLDSIDDGTCPQGDCPDTGLPVVILKGCQWSNLTVPYNLSIEPENTGYVIRWTLDADTAFSVPGDEHYFQVEGWNLTANRSLDPNIHLGTVRVVYGMDNYDMIVPRGGLDNITEIAIYWDLVRKEQSIYAYSNFSLCSVT